VIIGTYGPREIGKIYQPHGYGITDDNGVNVPVPYMVLRESSEAAWIAEQELEGFWGSLERVRFRLNPKALHYYEVSVD
jgi:hypothetical protein